MFSNNSNSTNSNTVQCPGYDRQSGSGYTPPTILQQQQQLPPFPARGWGGVGGFTTPPPPPPLLCAPPLTVASSLGNPQMPSNSMFNSSSPMGYNLRLSSINTAAHKRKSEDDLEERSPVSKQLITEDRVSASLNSLHLSARYTSHTLGSPTDCGADAAALQDGSDDSDSDSGNTSTTGSAPRLYLSEDLTRVQPANTSALPTTLLKHLQRPGPCLEVVVWRPRANVLARGVDDQHRHRRNSSSGTRPATSDEDEAAARHARAAPTTTVVTTATTVTSNTLYSSYDNKVNNSSNCNTPVNSPDSGVSVSPPLSGTVPSRTEPEDPNFCDMEDEDAFSSSRGSSSRHNPFSLFYPSIAHPLDSSSHKLAPNVCTSAGHGSSSASLLSSESLNTNSSIDTGAEGFENNNQPSVPSAYIQSWVEENNNSGMCDLNRVQTSLGLLPPIPDDDDMDL